MMRLFMGLILGAGGFFATPALSAPAAVIGNPGTWVTTDDYPFESLILHQEGVSAISFIIDTQGRAKNCKLESSSGHAGLDKAACEAFLARAHYRPATDKKGRPIESTGSQRIRWQLPVEGETSDWVRMGIGTLVTRFMVEEDGSVTSCATEFNSKPMPEQPCPENVSRFRFNPPRNSDGTPIRQAMRMMMKIELDPDAK